MMRGILLTAFFFISSSLAAEHPEILFCFFERSGLLFDQLYNDPPRSLNCGNTTYCQKITGNYISLGDKRTHMVVKGCDGIEVPYAFYGPKCQKEGCYEITFNGEKYQMCCCKGHDCNAASSGGWMLVAFLAAGAAAWMRN
ncbi:hypothetical protein PMAYCL1PPCAC_26669 [Pristionchus mayeri]|uniref:UPAR/Ly6 domain-containing protein n=1 Tax=Pristionchus mayeri TaxID=1317129 RepID=A0AAN5I9I8_9BILA|nr:hypothetical protein PMAYCL1PPCAC_26669 [Pristionchus mayeri]